MMKAMFSLIQKMKAMCSHMSQQPYHIRTYEVTSHPIKILKTNKLYTLNNWVKLNSMPAC